MIDDSERSFEANTVNGSLRYLFQIVLHYLLSAAKSPESSLTPKLVILAYIKAWAIQMVLRSPELRVLYVSIREVNPFGKALTYIKNAANSPSFVC